ncbi:DUF968 domain-containing protein [Hafnia alvei]|uniref:DUF968 domain-containing protein n=1 Tax=Hafnia TaxID=568 RepID=UPI000BBA42BD|nr:MULTISPECIES: DUF968 domain-containing protein [Hafnia]MEB7888812.1 DUF968 domain-containing protein [Hafnia alvei]QIP56302.1 DUF968 domain-containing protein [Hafnia alvei]TBL91224.1 DUF968 domain-containing protein [Hafnia alvei]WNN50828.1 DUF968 domain-containing protein [Hafnia alvei]
MRLLLTAFPQSDLGVVLLRPGTGLMHHFKQQQRLYISDEPRALRELPTGEIPAEHQTLAADPRLSAFWANDRVYRAAGGLDSLLTWLDEKDECQWHADWHHKELVTTPYEGSAVRLCWSCDNRTRTHFTEAMMSIAMQNRIECLLEAIRIKLDLSEGREISFAEVCWWATLNGVADLLPAYAITGMELPTIGGTTKEADINPWEPDPFSIVTDLVEQVKPVIKLSGDEAPPASFMLKPKLQRWECEKYTRWVKTQKCCGCSKPADDPHHVINHGLGGMGTKTHDLFVLPLCRRCHDKLHKDVGAWEQKHGDQRFLLIEFLNYALGVGAIFKA